MSDDDLDIMPEKPSTEPEGFLAELEKQIEHDLESENAEAPAPADKEQPPAPQDGNGSATDEGSKPEPQQEKPSANPAQEVAPREGAERRLWEERNILRAERANLTNTNNQLRANLDAARQELEATRAAVQAVANAEPQVVARAVNFWNQLQANPTATIQQLLTEAAAAGIRVPEAGQAVDTAALVERKVQEALAPLLAPLQQQQEQARAQEKAEKVYNEFISKYPDADIQADAIGALLERDPRLTLDGAYYQLKLAFAQNGLDWTKPLAEQLNSPNHASEVTAPRVQGRAAPSAPMVPANRNTVASINKSFGDIVKEVMKEHGIGS